MTNQLSVHQSTALSTKPGDMKLIERVCKSLPASPFVTPCATPESSPHIVRKNAPIPNRFFTGAFGATEVVQNSEQSVTYKGSWILSGLLGPRDASVTAVERPGTLVPISETEEMSRTPAEFRRNKSDGELLSPTKQRKESDSSSPVNSPDSDSESLSASLAMENNNVSERKARTVKPKPSELREMNFWSPTSM